MRYIPKILLSWLIISAFLFKLTGCLPTAHKNEPEKEPITERIQYDVSIQSDDQDLHWWVNNIEGSKREPFVKWLLDAAYSGKHQAYDYFNKPLSIDDVKSLGIDTTFVTLMREVPPYDEYDTIVIQQYDYRDIAKVRFLEEWYFGDGGQVIQKKVLGVAPVLVRKYGDEEYNEVLFWIYFDEDYPDALK